jgi:hypothetical protein
LALLFNRESPGRGTSMTEVIAKKRRIPRIFPSGKASQGRRIK